MENLFDTAKQLAALVEARSRAMKVPVTISVVDTHGNLVLKHRIDWAPLISLEMAERKAYTAALLEMRTEDITSQAQPGQPMFTITSVSGGRFVAFGGGAPLYSDGALVAGVGVSGGTTEQDIEILEAALAGVRNRPPEPS